MDRVGPDLLQRRAERLARQRAAGRLGQPVRGAQRVPPRRARVGARPGLARRRRVGVLRGVGAE